MSHDDEITEIIEYITGMRRTFNRKLDDHLFIIEQQNHRIEEQYRIIDEQRKSNCACNYENHVSKYRNKDLDLIPERGFRLAGVISKFFLFFISHRNQFVRTNNTCKCLKKMRR